ncbi:ATP synthase F1 subunit gamma [Inediibacterium massiliense]|uniref:ATP synthase F1 subunit gamma n=1 Tax=Inediibacterium massiliense TaxID=1658111 RepID=UPI0006B617EF|nr:ATP synthase F1 subunit gamma [Inediibacterium massiliense]
MAGMGMRDIKRRIKSVNNTKQITKAMELVSSAKLRRAREKADTSRPYFETIQKTVKDIFSKGNGIRHPYVTQREVKKSCYIVITGDRGLCGGYNVNSIKKAVENMDNQENTSIISIGQKARDYFRNRKYTIDGEFVHISESPTYADAKKIGELARKLYDKEMVDEVYLVYTKFISTVSQNPERIKLLPLSVEKTDQKEEEFEYIDYQPSLEGLLGYLVPQYIESTIYGALVEAAASEQAARRVAMENATDNAEEMIGKLTLHYNRARQAAITQEIAEIVGGAEALK